MKTFSNKVLTKPEAEQALDTAIALVRRNLPLYTDHCQNHSSVHDIYPQCENNQWTCGFWPGEVWLSYERTGDEAFKNTALTLVDSFLYRIEHKIEVDHHDMGFLYSPSCVAAYKLTGSEKGRKAAILAADQLCTRFQEKGEFFQAWGALGAADNYRYIIDCLLNVPLLYWASETTGDAHYADLAHKHVTTCLANSIRPDGSTYHTFFMDPVTGGPVRIQEVLYAARPVRAIRMTPAGPAVRRGASTARPSATATPDAPSIWTPSAACWPTIWSACPRTWSRTGI